uniref:Uncharacterized protein n=1 Tax=Arion vulgaris TaxID=1028688 RepID=A0A0B7A5K4_9EUPU
MSKTCIQALNDKQKHHISDTGDLIQSHVDINFSHKVAGLSQDSLIIICVKRNKIES